MRWTVKYIAESDWVLLVVTGEILDDDAREMVAATIGLLRDHQAHLVLADCSEAETKTSLPGLYRLPDYATELGAPWNARMAVVVCKTRFRIETFHFFALVFRNAGYEVRLFDDRQSAEAWLGRPTAVLTAAPQLASA